MTNPSTVWAQLALPNPPAGSLPFVSSDGATIVTDVLNLMYSGGLSSYAGSQAPLQLTVFGGVRVGYSDTTAVPGAAVINKPAGRVKIAAGQTTLVVTSSYAFATSIIRLIIETADATLTRCIPVPAAGSFTITGNAAATAAVTISFTIENVF